MRTRTLIIAAGFLTLITACSGATATDVEGDLPEDFDDSAAALAFEPEPGDNDFDDAADKDHKDHKGKGKDKADRDRDDDGDGDGRRKHKKHRHHHLFKKLDRLDGDKDRTIAILALPARVPPRVIEKLHEIDTNHDGIVTRDESHDYCHAKHHDWRH